MLWISLCGIDTEPAPGSNGTVNTLVLAQLLVSNAFTSFIIATVTVVVPTNVQK